MDDDQQLSNLARKFQTKSTKSLAEKESPRKLVLKGVSRNPSNKQPKFGKTSHIVPAKKITLLDCISGGTPHKSNPKDHLLALKHVKSEVQPIPIRMSGSSLSTNDRSPPLDSQSQKLEHRKVILQGHTPQEALELYDGILTPFEMAELIEFTHIYTIGRLRIHSCDQVCKQNRYNAQVGE